MCKRNVSSRLLCKMLSGVQGSIKWKMGAKSFVFVYTKSTHMQNPKPIHTFFSSLFKFLTKTMTAIVRAQEYVKNNTYLNNFHT